MTLTMGEGEAAGDEPLEMRRGSNYGDPGQYGPPAQWGSPGSYGQQRYGSPPAPGEYGPRPASRSRVPLLVLVVALALAALIVVLLLLSR